MARFNLKWLAAACVTLSAFGAAQAQDFPSRPVTVVSPFPAGGATDTLTRILAEHMSKTLKQPMIVENRPGAGTLIGASYVAKQPADGYTMLMATNSTLVTNRYLYKSLPYDPDGFDPIGMVAIGPLVLLASPNHKFTSTKDVVDYAKANPGKLSFATFGPGTSSHLAAELFKTQAGIDMLHIPYKGATQALPDLISGNVDVFFDMVATGMPQVKAGKITALGMTSKDRLESEATVPTIAEQGYPKYDMAAWFSFVAPKGTPQAELDTLSNALQAALKDEALRTRLLGMGIETRSGTAQELTDQIKNEQPLVKSLVENANIVLQ